MHFRKVIYFFGVLLLFLLGIIIPIAPTNTTVSKHSYSDTTIAPPKSIVREYEYYTTQLSRNYPKLQSYIDNLVSFDTINSKGKPLSRQEYEKYVVALVTQESNFIQKKYDGSILKSYANAVGVAQFTTEGVKAVNKYLSQKRDTTGKTKTEQTVCEQYAKHKDVDFELLLDTGETGLKEGYRATTLLTKIQLLHHPDSWRFAAIEYNWGRMRRGDYDRIKRRLPRETRDYVKRIEQHMTRYEKGDYLRYLKLRWGVVMVELENMHGNTAIKKDEPTKAIQHFENAIALNDYLIQNDLDTVMRYHENILLHANYELGNLNTMKGDTLAGLDCYFEVIKFNNKKKRYEYRNAKLYLNQIKKHTTDSTIMAYADEIIWYSDSLKLLK